MTDRERWIVYPLIFLTLGIALRDKLTRTLTDVELIGGKTVAMDLRQGEMGGTNAQLQLDFARGQIEAQTIHCQQLVVEQSIRGRQITADQVAGRELVVITPGGSPRVILHTDATAINSATGQASGRIVLYDSAGNPQITLLPGTDGGELSLVDRTLKRRLNFGGFHQGVVMEAETSAGQRFPLVSFPAETFQSVPQPAEPAHSKADDPGPPEPSEE